MTMEPPTSADELTWPLSDPEAATITHGGVTAPRRKTQYLLS